MDQHWEHRTDTTADEARQWARAGDTVIVETRPAGSFAETTTLLTALDVATGSVRWQQECPPLGLNQAMTVAGDLLVVLHTDDKPSARGYDVATGAVRWTHPLAGEPRGATTVGDDVAVVAGSSIRRLDPTGRPVAKASLAGTALTTLAVTDDGDLVTTSGRGRKNILRLAGDTLAPVWDARVQGEGWTYRNPPLVTSDAVFFHSTSLWAMALDAATGDLRWRRKKAAGRGGVVLPGPEGSVLWGADALARVRAQDGKVLWQSPRVIAAAVDGDAVFVARRADTSYSYAPEEPVAVRIEGLDAATGEAFCGTDLADVRRHWVAGDMSDRLFAHVNGLLVCGLEPGRVRAFRAPRPEA